MTTISNQRVIEYNVPGYYKAPPPLSFSEGSALQIQNQVHRTDLNGKFVVCLGRDSMRTLVMTSSGDTLSVADSHLSIVEIVPGTRVTLVGLSGLLNGQTAIAASFNEAERMWTVQSGEDEIAVKPVNLVITPEGSEEALASLHPIVGKKRRLIANLVSSASDAGGRPHLAGAPGLLSGNPIPGATARLIAIDAAVAMSNQQPILKRCGTLRKLVHGFPGFAQLVVCVMVKLHLDPSHPGRVMDAGDAPEAVRIAQTLTDSKLDGIPRRDLKELVAAGEVSMDTVLRIADRYCGANHLAFMIDSNFAGIRDTITTMVHQLTSGGLTNVAVASTPAVLDNAAADMLMEDVPPPTITTEHLPASLVSDTPIIPMDKVMTSLMASRYAKPGFSNPADSMDVSPPEKDD